MCASYLAAKCIPASMFGGGAYLRREIPPGKKKVKKIPHVACRLKKMSYLCSRKRDEGACEPREIVPQTSLREVSCSVLVWFWRQNQIFLRKNFGISKKRRTFAFPAVEKRRVSNEFLFGT